MKTVKRVIETGKLDGKEYNYKRWRSQVLGQCKSWIDGGSKKEP